MHIRARTLTVKGSCVQTLEIKITTDISWDNEASGALAHWEHGPIIPNYFRNYFNLSPTSNAFL